MVRNSASSWKTLLPGLFTVDNTQRNILENKYIRKPISTICLMHYHLLKLSKQIIIHLEILCMLMVCRALRSTTMESSPYIYVWLIKGQKNRSHINLSWLCKGNALWNTIKFHHKTQPNKSKSWKLYLWKECKIWALKT